MQYNQICVVDLETCSNRTSDTEIVQIGAKIINPRNLTTYSHGEFFSTMRVLDEHHIQESALVAIHKTREEILVGPEPGEVWHCFTEWLKQWYIKGKTSDIWCAPIAAGHNIIHFDLPILNRYALEYGTTREHPNGEIVPALFHPIINYDSIHLVAYWSENLKQPGKLGMDYLRKFMGYSKERSEVAHNALEDVRDEAALLIKLLGLSRGIAPRVKFKNCFGYADK